MQKTRGDPLYRIAALLYGRLRRPADLTLAVNSTNRRLSPSLESDIRSRPQTTFDLIELAADLDRVGFRLEENLGPAEIEERYFRQRADEYHAFEHVHFARAVVV